MPEQDVEPVQEVMTVTCVVSAGGQLWAPGQPVTSPLALKRISDDKLVPLNTVGKHAEDDARSSTDGAEWYNHRTVKTVLDGVGSDVGRAAYALERERDRPKPRQRVLEALIPMVFPDDGDQEDEDAGDDEGGG